MGAHGVNGQAELVDEAVKTAGKIATMSKPIVAMCKEAVNKAGPWRP